MEFSRPEYWSGYSSPGDLSTPGIKPRSPALQADSLPTEPWGKPLKEEDKYNIWTSERQRPRQRELQLCRWNKIKYHGFFDEVWKLWPWFQSWRRKWQPTPYSCLENSMNRGAWWAPVHGVTKSWTWLSDFLFRWRSNGQSLCSEGSCLFSLNLW